MTVLSKGAPLWAALALVACGPMAARAGEIVYAETFDNAQFGTLDLSSGLFTPIGPGGGFSSKGMAVAGGKIYAIDFNKSLYSVDPVTGTYTFIGDGGPSEDYYTIGSTTGGGAFSGWDTARANCTPSTRPPATSRTSVTGPFRRGAVRHGRRCPPGPTPYT